MIKWKDVKEFPPPAIVDHLILAKGGVEYDPLDGEIESSGDEPPFRIVKYRSLYGKQGSDFAFFQQSLGLSTVVGHGYFFYESYTWEHEYRDMTHWAEIDGG